MVLDQVPEPCQQVPPDVGVTHLAAPELDRHLDPVAVLQELDRAPDLGVEIALADLRLEADLLEVDGPLVPPCLLVATCLLVLELAVVEKLGNRRSRHRRNLDEVVPSLLRHLEGLVRGQHAKLSPLLVDDPQLGHADHLVDAQIFAQARILIGAILSAAPNPSGRVFRRLKAAAGL